MSKVVIITGGSSGIGLCTAAALRDRGCKVYELSRRDSEVEGITHLRCDITDEEQIKAAVAQVLDENGRIDILINNAGVGISGAVEFTRRASEKCTVSVAHTDASYEEAAAVFDAGATHLTHLYNAMPGIHHRHPGPIGAASERESVTAELICDGHHVHPSAVRMAFRLFPNRVCLISDALRCCGMPDGQYTLGGQDVFLAGGVARLSDGTIAGSAANLYDCMRNAAAFDVPVEQAVLAATAIPAREIGRAGETGSIADGLPADFVVCDDTLARQAVYLGGERL